ncbi:MULTISPECIES: hypothetical protein [Vibrio]|uniref:hypothetical protein n=1 Tax=Vibrio TaxID=662 RepID=UPI0012F502CC|nr:MULTISPECIES: hypothetical protein [Vibrio]MBE8564074.1 hypothetical protein [Vibrio sp. OPT20]
MAMWIPVICLVVLSGLGFVSVFRRKLVNNDKIEFVVDFNSKFVTYWNSKGQDRSAFGLLIRHSNKMQNNLGNQGVAAKFKPPYLNVVYQDYPIIINMLPSLDDALSTPGFMGGIGDDAVQYAKAIEQTLLRHIGSLEANDETLVKQLRNPVIWLREGIRSVLSLPVHFVSWFGLISATTAIKITSSWIFRFLSGFTGLIGLFSAIMGIALGWEEFVKMASKFF